jgi:hypothetical protein
VNTYASGASIASDLDPGPGQLGNWNNFHPVIAELVSADTRGIAERQAGIPPAEWARCEALGRALVRARPGRWRDGSPLHSFRPAGSLGF